MNRHQIIELFKINLLYASPQNTTQLRNKNKNSRQIVRSLLSQYLLMGVIFTAIYGVIMLPSIFRNFPDILRFTVQCL